MPANRRYSGIVGEGRRGAEAACRMLASERRREEVEGTDMDSKRRRETTSGSGAWRGFACGTKMEEPKKSRKSGKRRAAKTVIGTREKHTQGEPVVEGMAVVVTTESDGDWMGCNGGSGELSRAGGSGGAEKGERGKC